MRARAGTLIVLATVCLAGCDRCAEAIVGMTVEHRLEELATDPLFAELGVGAELVIGLRAPDVTDSKVLDDVRALTEALENSPGVISVESIANRTVVTDGGGEMLVESFRDAAAGESRPHVRRELLAKHAWGRPLITPDGRGTLVFVYSSQPRRSPELQALATRLAEDLEPVFFDSLRDSDRRGQLPGIALPTGALRIRVELSRDGSHLDPESLDCLEKLETAAAEAGAKSVSLLNALEGMATAMGVGPTRSRERNAQLMLLLEMSGPDGPSHLLDENARNLIVTIPVAPGSGQLAEARDLVGAVQCPGLSLWVR